jgi:pantoate--beta-alanine ligase
MSTVLNKEMMEIIHDTAAMQRRCLELRAAGKTISFVPTMGYLHEGHLSLLRAGRERGDILVLSIFVNPTQFGPNEDLDNYPQDMENDLALARSVGVDLVWTPTPQQVYPDGYATYVNVEGLTDLLCGASRPEHFRGVTTVVCKLFNVVQPNVALFGQKDFQQLAVIRRMVADLNMPVEVTGMPIVREADGLAMSSRNVYLSADQRQQALVLSQAIAAAQQSVRTGEGDSRTILDLLRQKIEAESETSIDYLQICHQLTLEDQERIDVDSVLLLAVFVGETRLLDNSFLL